MKTKNLNLPETDFPQKADSTNREPGFNEFWENEKVFKKRSESNTGSTFTLHDGPPYANGSSHVGHALNKLLKDVVNKYKLMSGHKVKYVPGWDCHGLPTELKVQQDFGKGLPQHELREHCTDHANKYVNLQKDFFKRLGLMGEWDKPYLTMSKEFETNQLKAFSELYFKGLVYRDEKPVHYSPSTKTVLADAELEYLDRDDTSVYFKFPTKEFNLVAWTTMPWTLPGNKAVCLNPEYNYSVVEYKGEKLLLNSDRLDFMSKVLEYEFNVEKEFKGKELEGLEYTNPLNGETHKVLVDRFVDNKSGTGLVHMCPAHGDEDFRVCKANDVEPELLLDNDGNFLSNGLYALGKGTESVLESMCELNMTLKTEVVNHSYPHDWRTKEPVVFMLTKQFFLKLENKEEMLNVANGVDFSKSSYKNRFKNMLYDRDSWCLSRQRTWGFPLTVFFDDYDNVLFDKDVYEHLNQLFEEHGSNCWFKMEADELLPEKYRNKGYRKCKDTMDVWLESGLSWHNVLKQDDELNNVADLYFEGSDQHRGWFQSSFLTSFLLTGEAPYKKVLTHGFVLDKHGRKMSKSLGNVVDPLDVVNDYNADVLRLWTLSVDYTKDVRLGDTMLDTMSKNYFKLRNNFRYLLSNLNDYDTNYVPVDMCEKDLTALDDLDKFLKKLKEAYSTYDFRSVYNLTTNYVAFNSKKYFDLETKELLYEAVTDSKERRNRQFVMNKMLNELTKWLAPMTPYLCEDVYQFTDKKEFNSVFFETLD